MSDDELTLILGRIIAARDHLQPVISAATRYIDHNRAIQDCDWHDGRDVAIHVRSSPYWTGCMLDSDQLDADVESLLDFASAVVTHHEVAGDSLHQ